MNRLLTEYTGKMPIYLDDLRFIDEIYRNAIISLASGILNASPCVLTGCTVTKTVDTISVTEGYVYFQNEIFYSPAKTLVDFTTSKIYVWKVIENTSSIRLFGNGVDSHPAYLIRYADLQEALEVPDADELAFLGSSAPDYLSNRFDLPYANQSQTLAGQSGYVLSPQQLQDHQTWNNAIYLNDWVQLSRYPLRTRKLTNGLYQLEGSCFNGNLSATYQVANISNLNLPTKAIQFDGYVWNNPAQSRIKLMLNTNGLLTIDSSDDVIAQKNIHFNLFYS